MNNRLSITDLAELLAERTGKDSKNTELFLREFIVVVSQGLYTDKVVKVKGLGTFRITWVEKRESIHVNTGERILIPEHYKFYFLPDKELKDVVNRPFSFFERIEITGNADFPDLDVSEETDDKDTEDESVEEIIPEKIITPADEIPIIPVVTEESEEQAELEQQEEPEELLKLDVPVEEPVSSEVEDAVPAFEPEVEPEPPVTEPIHLSIPETEGQMQNVYISSSSIKKKLIVVALFIVIIVAGGLFYLNRNLFITSETPALSVDESIAGISLPKDTNPEKKAEQPVGIPNKTDTLTVVPTEETTITPPTPSPEVIAKVKIEPGSRLTLISLDYYGSKIFWVYLYEYNKAKIQDPNNVPVGTEISVPAPGVYGIDVRNRASVEKAAARQTEILSGKR